MPELGAPEHERPAPARSFAPPERLSSRPWEPVLAEDHGASTGLGFSRASFLQALKEHVTREADRELEAVGRSAQGCPYIAFWLDYYARVPAEHLERAVRRYAKPRGDSVPEFLRAIGERTVDAIRTWKETGEMARLPDAPLPQLPLHALAADPQLLVDALGLGAPVPPDLRVRAQRVFGRALPDVRMHTSGEAALLPGRLGARALAVGRHVVVGHGQYRPGTRWGDALLGHELAHTLQQEHATRGRIAPPSRAHEREADVAGVGFAGHDRLHGFQPRLSSSTSLALQGCDWLFGWEEEFETGDAGDAGDVDDIDDIPPSVIQAPSVPDVTYDGTVPMPDPRKSHDFEGGWEVMKLDGDGDQVPELRVRMRDKKKAPDPGSKLDKVTELEIELALLSDLKHPQSHVFDLSKASMRPYSTLLIHTRATDGYNPMKLELEHGTRVIGSDYNAELYPPTPGAKQRDYRLKLLIGYDSSNLFTVEHTYSFAQETAKIYQVFLPGTPQHSGGVTTIPVRVGAFGDRFLLTFEQLKGQGDEVTMGLLPTTEDLQVRQGSTTRLGVFSKLDVKVLSSIGPQLTLDLDGDGKGDLSLYVTEQAEWDLSSTVVGHKDPATDRSLSFYVVSPKGGDSAGRFDVRAGKLELGGSSASASGLAVSAAATAAPALAAAKAAGGEAVDLLALLEKGRADIRAKAAEGGLFSSHEQFKELFDAIAQLVVSVNGGKAVPGIDVLSRDEAFVRCKEKATAFDKAFSTETASFTTTSTYQPPYGVEKTTTSSNKYTGLYTHETNGKLTGAQSARHALRLRAALELKNFKDSLAEFRNTAWYMDVYVQDRLAAGKSDQKALAQKLKTGNTLRTELEKLPHAKSPKRVFAVFTPQESFTNTGVPSTNDVLLFYWKDGTTWYLRDLTRPDKIFTDTYDAKDGETEPPHDLFLKLNYEKHFSEGYVHYELPSGRGGVVRIEHNDTWKDYLTWAALGLAAAAFIVGTAGAGSAVVTTLVVASAVAGAISSALNIQEMLSHGYVDAGEITMEVINIASSLAGAGGLVIRELAVAASVAKTAAAAAKSSKLATALKAWAAANKAIVFPLGTVAVAGDVINLGVMVGSIYESYQAIDKSPGTEGDRLRARLWLLTKAAGMGALGMLAVRGGYHDLKQMKSLTLEGVGNGLVLRGAPGSIPHADYEQTLKDALKTSKLEAELKVVKPEELAALTKSEGALAVTRIENGKPVVYVLDGAHPRVVMEESIHVQQLADPKLAKLSAKVTDALDKGWSKLGTAERFDALKAKFELEIDAQKKLIALYEGTATANPRIATALDEAYQNLEGLRDRYGRILGAEKGAKSSGPKEALLEQPPELTTKLPQQGFDLPDEWKTLSKEDFAAAYKKKYPNTTLTDDELIRRFEHGKRLNPDTWRLKDPTYKGRPKPEIEAQFVPNSEKTPKVDDTIGYGDKAKLKELLDKRDKAWAAKRKSGASEADLGKAHYEMNEASREIGELVADAFVKKQFPGATRIYGGGKSRPGDFDAVYKVVDSTKKPPVTKYIVVEAKGGGADLGVRKIAATGKVAEQGTKEYFDEIARLMEKEGADKSNKAMLDAATALSTAAPGDLVYLLVKTPIAGPPSAVDKLMAKTFLLTPP